MNTPQTKPAWNVEAAMRQVRTPIGVVLMLTAGVGVFVAAHWQPLILLMTPFYFATLLAPGFVRRPITWFLVAALWAVAVIVRRNNMEDHVYLYLAWLVAIGVSLIVPATFIKEAGRHGRYLIALVFGFATFWKLVSGSFLSGATLWTTAVLDDRMRPLFRLIGISGESLDQARPGLSEVIANDGASLPIELSGYSSLGLTAVAIGTVVLEGAIAITHAVPDTNKLAKLRIPGLVVFGLITYAVVPVLPFALLLALIGVTMTSFDKKSIAGLAFMVLVTIVRFATL